MSQLSSSQLLVEVEAFASNPPEDVLADGELRARLYRACGAARASLEQPTELVTRVLENQVRKVLVM